MANTKSMDKLVIASKNDGKLREIRDILDLKKTKILTYQDFKNWPSIKEKGKSFAENAYIKAKAVLEEFGLPVLADDSGLEVHILKGEPGVRSSKYAGATASSKDNNRKLLSKLMGYPKGDRKAQFRCSGIFLAPSGQKLTAEGTCEGYIAKEERGTEGFGYDPLFIPVGYEKSIAELPPEVKNSISHRGKAIRKLRQILKEIGVE